MTTIELCKNYGKIESKEDKTHLSIGGIMGGFSNGNLLIINTINYGEVNANNSSAGGIIGVIGGQSWDNCINAEIINSANYGKVDSRQNTSGGIIGYQGTTCKENFVSIRNTYNIGEATGKIVGNVIGRIENWSSTETRTEFDNVYYIQEPLLSKGSLTSGEATLKSLNEIKSQTFVDLLNQNIGENTDWKNWKLGEKGYPELDL